METILVAVIKGSVGVIYWKNVRLKTATLCPLPLGKLVKEDSANAKINSAGMVMKRNARFSVIKSKAHSYKTQTPSVPTNVPARLTPSGILTSSNVSETALHSHTQPATKTLKNVTADWDMLGMETPVKLIVDQQGRQAPTMMLKGIVNVNRIFTGTSCWTLVIESVLMKVMRQILWLVSQTSASAEISLSGPQRGASCHAQESLMILLMKQLANVHANPMLFG